MMPFCAHWQAENLSCAHLQASNKICFLAIMKFVFFLYQSTDARSNP